MAELQPLSGQAAPRGFAGAGTVSRRLLPRCFLLEPAYYFAGTSLFFCYNRPWSSSLLNLFLLEPAHIFARSWYFFCYNHWSFFPIKFILLELEFFFAGT